MRGTVAYSHFTSFTSGPDCGTAHFVEKLKSSTYPTMAVHLSSGISVTSAHSPLRRMLGLIGQPALGPGQALLICGARQVHTFGMSYTLDVVFLDASWNLLHLVHGIRPRRISKWVRASHYVIEVAAGWLDDGRLDLLVEACIEHLQRQEQP